MRDEASGENDDEHMNTLYIVTHAGVRWGEQASTHFHVHDEAIERRRSSARDARETRGGKGIQ